MCLCERILTRTEGREKDHFVKYILESPASNWGSWSRNSPSRHQVALQVKPCPYAFEGVFILQLQVLVLVVMVIETIPCLAPWFRSYLSALFSGPLTFTWVQFLSSFPLSPLSDQSSVYTCLSEQYVLPEVACLSAFHPSRIQCWSWFIENSFDSETQSKPESLQWLNQLDIWSWKKSVATLYKLVGPTLKAFLDTRILNRYVTKVDIVSGRLHWCWESH